MSKRYFWLKLKNDFFSQKEIKMLRRIAGGDTYTIIYLKMLLKSLKNDGKIYYDGIADNMIEEIALDIDEDVDNVQITFNFLMNKNLIRFSEDDEINMENIASMIGSETDAARRKRKQRKREQKRLECDNVTTESQPSHTEIEKELELDKEKESMSGKPDRIPYAEIVDYLNEKADRQFRSTTNKTQSLIRARFNDGWKVKHFKTVIDNKVAQWKDDNNMQRYLRPDTLFGTKFEGYLNEDAPKKSKQEGGSYAGIEF
ncbi:replication protein [Dolosigranulum pigrum]|uniref:conserved phage C-terminal domain-containing protein n=1 Tax=Dolosigranulum pigrum TaxID=29394 RepID=UPI001AD8586B|nr:conserved phage C-terminal domain-containing protein [Dolosigranulum pigrum]QTJ50505.1 replication protein [Dolosigranulum pigrum]